MALSICKCSLCNFAFQAHAYQKGGIMRQHLKEAHPEAEAEIRAFELDLHKRRAELRAKYGKDFMLFVH